MTTAKTNAKAYLSAEQYFLTELLNTQIPVSVYLTRGIQLKGYLVGFDQYTLRLKSFQPEQLGHQVIYKRAITTVLPRLLRGSERTCSKQSRTQC